MYIKFDTGIHSSTRVCACQPPTIFSFDSFIDYSNQLFYLSPSEIDQSFRERCYKYLQSSHMSLGLGSHEIGWPTDLSDARSHMNNLDLGCLQCIPSTCYSPLLAVLKEKSNHKLWIFCSCCCRLACLVLLPRRGFYTLLAKATYHWRSNFIKGYNGRDVY